LILLDPEGPELLWDTIKHLSKIKKAELFILFPYDMALARMVPDYKNRLDDFFGSKDWRDIYDSAKTPKKRKNRLLSHYLSNLNKLGFQHVSHKQIKTNLRDGRNLYHLIHTTHNSTAKKIIDHVFDKELDGQTKMKF
jgi:three-Cys-motif partner protein